MKGMKLIFFILILGFIVPALWDKVPAIKKSVHSILDPTLGSLLSLNINAGFVIIVAILTFISVLVFKYTTDQKTLREIREEQKILQEEMKRYKEHPEKLMEFQKKSLDLTMKAMPITMRPAIFTIIPIILLFRWFTDFFSVHQVKIFGFLGWVLAYIILAIIFSFIFRKLLKVN